MRHLAVGLGDVDVSCEAKLPIGEELVLSVVLDPEGRQERVNALIDRGAKSNFIRWDVVRKYDLQKYVHRIKPIEVRPALRDSGTCEYIISVKAIMYAEKPIELVLEAGVMENLSREFYLGLPFVNQYQKFLRYPASLEKATKLAKPTLSIIGVGNSREQFATQPDSNLRPYVRTQETGDSQKTIMASSRKDFEARKNPNIEMWMEHIFLGVSNVRIVH